MNIYPKAYLNKVQDITIQFLIENKIKAIIIKIYQMM